MKTENKIYVVKGKDIRKMTKDILNLMNPLEGRSRDIFIGIKPNLVCVSRASEGATTHPEIVEGIIHYLKENGFNNMMVLESSWVGANTEDAADYCGYTTLCKKYDIPFINIKQTESTEHNVNGLKIQVSKYVEKLDYLINVPLIKGHCQTGITCALKNMKGLIPDAEKRRYHALGLHKPIACLNTVIKQDLIIADAICPDPYFEEGGRPKQMDMIAGAYDPVLMDCYAAEVLGYEPFDIKYIKLAYELGIGRIKDDATEIIQTGDQKQTERVQPKEKKYLKLVLEDNACSACYSSLVAAMERLNAEGLTEKLVDEISIGQGYRGTGGAVGIGDCTAGFERHVAGCPPKSEDIYNFLKAIAEEN